MSGDPLVILDARLRSAIAAACPGAPFPAEPLVTPSRRPELGDFQSSVAMPLARALSQRPQDIARDILSRLDLADLAERPEIAGPGFINIRLRADVLADLLEAIDAPDLGIRPAERRQTVVVDLCGVNLAKQMHVGHLRAMVIGDAIARVMERLGHAVHRQNHVGDWGLPIAMVTARLMRAADAGEARLDRVSLDDLDRLYRDAQRECDADSRGLDAALRLRKGPKAIAELEEQVAGAREAQAHARATLVRLQARDPAVLAVWRVLADVTMRECLALCARLRANVSDAHTAGESSFADELPALVDDLLARRIAHESDGAVVVRVDGIEEPCIVRKADGGFLYATTDLAAIRRRVQVLAGERLIYCVDARQALHFSLVFAVAHRAGYTRRPGADVPATLEHAAFGMVLGEDHRPLKTRAGENVRLSALLDEAEERALAAVDLKNPSLSPDERRDIASAVAVAAIKYGDLASDRTRDYVFSFDRLLAFEGNTGPYLLYAVVRVRSIFRKARDRGDLDDWSRAPILLHDPAERALALCLLRYAPVLHAVAEHLEPHRLCGYLYDLAGAFSAFFDACPVIQAPAPEIRRSRLRLCDLVARVMADGLAVLGVPTLERM
jgi:arginyl-tRNA synthetase